MLENILSFRAEFPHCSSLSLPYLACIIGLFTFPCSAFCIAKFFFSRFCSLIPLQLVTRHGWKITAENTREKVFLLFHGPSARTSKRKKSHPHPLKSLADKNSLDDFAVKFKKMLNKYEVLFWVFFLLL